MKAILIFDSVNDLLFYKWDDEFVQRIKSFSGNISDDNVADSDNVSQLLAPIITSQRIMAAQFGNTYSSIQCKDNTVIVFDEWLDHVLMLISEDCVDDAERELMDCKTIAQHICGQNINLLQSPIYKEWLSVLLDSLMLGDSIPGANGIIGESGATAAALNALKTAAKELKLSYQHYHLMLFVGDKLLALYSSRGTEDLSPPDLILLSIQCIAAQEFWDEQKNAGDGEKSMSYLPWLSKENSAIVNLCAGSTNNPCAPHSMHIVEVAPRITLAVIIDMDLREVGITVHMSSQILCNLRRLLLQRNLELLPHTLDVLEASVKKTNEALRKTKCNANLCTRLSSRMLELRKSCTTTTPLTPETAATAMHTALEATNELLKPHIPTFNLSSPLKGLRSKLAPYVEFLCVKAMRYFSMGLGESDSSCSLTLHKYVEEFPGLIYFVYVDRTSGRFLAPDMADCVDMLSKEMARRTVSKALSVLREGYGAASWRSGAVRVCAMRWWERRGAPLRPRRPAHPPQVRALPPPGDIRAAFHRQLLELAFPTDTQGVSMKELICIHLGLLPASTAIQQARSLAHSVHEMTGDNPTVAADLL